MSLPLTQPGSSNLPAAMSAEGGGRTSRGPETVINPERRGLPVAVAGVIADMQTPAVAGGSMGPGQPAKSSIVRILFPADGDAPLPAFDAPGGVQLGHFTIIERVRTGGMGAVFRALDSRLSRVVALKVLPPVLSRDPLIVQRFKNEAQAAAQLDHDSVARVFYIGEEQGLHFIAFEFITGTNVRDLIHDRGRLPVADTLNFALQIGSALVHMAAQGVVHRDIKPSNIIVMPNGRAKLVDLGLARKENREDQAVDLTVAGTTLGTFDYISPEQARDPRTADVRSDIYSLGCTVYHMLSGEPPYPEGTVLQKLLQHQGDEAPNPAHKNHAVPENLSAVVRKMMAKDPRRRYQTPEQLVRDLMLVAAEMGLRTASPEGLVWISAQPARASFWERHLAWMATAAALLIIVGYMEFGGYRYGAPVNSEITAGPSGSSPASRTGAEGNGPSGLSAAAQSIRQPSELEEPGRKPDESVDSDDDLTGRTSLRDRVDAGNGRDDENDVDEGPDSLAANHQPPGSATVIKPFPLAARVRSIGEGGNSVFPPIETSVPGPDSTGTTSDIPGNSATPSTTAANGRTDDDAETAPPATAKNSRNASDDKSIPTESPATIPAPDEKAIVVLGRDGAPDRKYSSLASACNDVRNDGSEIELRFDGIRRESNLRINRKLRIRAARGFHPVLEFRPALVVTDGGQCRAITLPSGALEIVGIDLILSVDDAISAESWSLISVERPDSLRLERVGITLDNPNGRPVAAIELRPGAGAMMPDMPDVGAQPRLPLKVDLFESIVRGTGDLFLVRHAEPVRLGVEQSVVALNGTLLADRGHTESSGENAQLELQLEHVTAVLANGLVRLDGGTLPRKLLPVQVTASNSIFSNAAAASNPMAGALVSVATNEPLQDFRRHLAWTGRNNFYDRFQTFVAPLATLATGRSETWDFNAWRSYWTDTAESNPRRDLVVWKKRHWLSRGFTDLTPPDFALDQQAANNAAVAGATNARDDAGANLTQLPALARGTEGARN